MFIGIFVRKYVDDNDKNDAERRERNIAKTMG